MGLTFLFDVIYGKEMKRITVHGREQDLKRSRRTCSPRPCFLSPC